LCATWSRIALWFVEHRAAWEADFFARATGDEGWACDRVAALRAGDVARLKAAALVNQMLIAQARNCLKGILAMASGQAPIDPVANVTTAAASPAAGARRRTEGSPSRTSRRAGSAAPLSVAPVDSAVPFAGASAHSEKVEARGAGGSATSADALRRLI
jgi:hypothetical protein